MASKGLEAIAREGGNRSVELFRKTLALADEAREREEIAKAREPESSLHRDIRKAAAMTKSQPGLGHFNPVGSAATSVAKALAGHDPEKPHVRRMGLEAVKKQRDLEAKILQVRKNMQRG